MKVKKIFLSISIIIISVVSFIGCKKDDPIKDFYGTYQLTQLQYSYYDNGVNRSGWLLSIPQDTVFFGSAEQNSFYYEVLNLLGNELTFSKEAIKFSGTYKNAVSYKYEMASDDGFFRLNFDNLLSIQNGETKKYINSGSTSVWEDYQTKTVKSRTIRIACSLYVKSENLVDFKPVATFEFEYFCNYN